MSTGGMGNRATVADDSVPPRTSSVDVREPAEADASSTQSALLSTIMASTSSAMLLTDGSGTVIAANPAFELLAGVAPADIVGRLLSTLLTPGQESQLRTIRRAVARRSVWQGDVSIHAREGVALSLRIKITPVLETRDQMTHLVVEARDDQRKRVLSELTPEAQTLGRLSSSIAHDFNNQLSVIINYTHILSRQIAKDSALQAHLHDMQTTAWRASKLAQQLIVLGRRPMAEPQPLDLNQVINNLTPLLRTMLGERVQLRMSLQPGLWSVLMALPQAEQVLVNLAVNAREAIYGAGDVELTTANVTFNAEDPQRPADLAPGRYVQFSLSEQAANLDPATITPVDATAPLSGLGPTMIYRAVEQAGGSLALLANEDGGTTFRIHVPALSTDPEAAPEPVTGIRTLS